MDQNMGKWWQNMLETCFKRYVFIKHLTIVEINSVKSYTMHNQYFFLLKQRVFIKNLLDFVQN